MILTMDIVEQCKHLKTNVFQSIVKNALTALLDIFYRVNEIQINDFCMYLCCVIGTETMADVRRCNLLSLYIPYKLVEIFLKTR